MPRALPIEPRIFGTFKLNRSELLAAKSDDLRTEVQMPGQKRIRNVIGAFIIAGVCLLSVPTAAQQSGPQSKEGSVSDDDFIKLHQQIKELKNPTFRAFLRIRLLSWEAPEPTATRRQAAMEIATQGVTDLCEHHDEIWAPTAAWLHAGFGKQIKTLQSSGETALKICVLKTDTKNNSAKDLSSGIRMLSNPETSAAGLNLAKSAILSGQVSAETMLGQLISPNATHSPHLPELLNAVLVLEEQQPGALPLRVMPFFTSVFLAESVPSEIQMRFLVVAVRSSRLSAEELANPMQRSLVTTLLNGIINRAQQLTPALYPEVAARLSSVDRTALNRIETRLAAEERIQKASDPLEQLIFEANSASDEQLKKHFFLRAARQAKEQGQVSKAVDLVMKTVNDSDRNKDQSQPSWFDDFLSELVLLALKKESPLDATYAISKLTQRLQKARAFRVLGEHYGANQDKSRMKEAFAQSAKQLKAVDSSNEKVKASLLLAESVLKYEPADAYEAFRESIKTINTLPSPENDQEKMHYVKLLPVAEDLIRSFRLLGTRENQTATSLAAEIKIPELRLSALSGITLAQH